MSLKNLGSDMVWGTVTKWSTQTDNTIRQFATMEYDTIYISVKNIVFKKYAQCVSFVGSGSQHVLDMFIE